MNLIRYASHHENGKLENNVGATAMSCSVTFQQGLHCLLT